VGGIVATKTEEWSWIGAGDNWVSDVADVNLAVQVCSASMVTDVAVVSASLTGVEAAAIGCQTASFPSGPPPPPPTPAIPIELQHIWEVVEVVESYTSTGNYNTTDWEMFRSRRRDAYITAALEHTGATAFTSQNAPRTLPQNTSAVYYLNGTELVTDKDGGGVPCRSNAVGSITTSLQFSTPTSQSDATSIVAKLNRDFVRVSVFIICQSTLVFSSSRLEQPEPREPASPHERTPLKSPTRFHGAQLVFMVVVVAAIAAVVLVLLSEYTLKRVALNPHVLYPQLEEAERFVKATGRPNMSSLG
jgi:hypothetical protein